MTDRAYLRNGHELTRAEATTFLTHDEDGEDTGGLRVPCSRWGRDGSTCAVVAVELATLISEATGEPATPESFEYAMGLVVNDHDDVAYMFREYGDERLRAEYADELGESDHEDGGQ